MSQPRLLIRLVACLLLAAACVPSPSGSGFQTEQPRTAVPVATRQAAATDAGKATAGAQPSQSATAIPAPTGSACLDAEEISLDHVGQALCVTGIVDRAFNTSEASYVEFGTAFYLLSYDVDLSGIAPKTCLTIQGEIKRLGSKPLIVVGRNAPPADCSSGLALRVGSFSGVIVGAPPTHTPTPLPAATEPVPPTPVPPTNVPPPPTQAPPPPNCHPSYPGVCIPPPPPDLDCGDIPHRRFAVVGSDPHRFDGDNDGVGCES